MKPITVAQLIKGLKSMNTPNALVGISVDSEGNGFSLIANEQFLMQGFMPGTLGYAEFYENETEGTKPTIIIFGSN